MPTFTVQTAVATGRQREWTTGTGDKVFFDLWAVQFAEAPGLMLEIGQTKKQGQIFPGMKMDGEIKSNAHGSYFKRDPKPQQQGGGQRYGGGSYRRGDDDTQRYIIAQCALKCAIEMSKAQEKYDTPFLESAMGLCWELIHRFADRKVDAPPQPQAPQQAMPPQPQYQQAPQQQGYPAAPQQHYHQQPQYAHAGAPGGNGYGEEIPF